MMKRFFLLFTVVGVVLSTSVGICAAAKSSEANQLARKGTEAARNGQWDEAIDDLRKAHQMDRKYTPSLVAALLGRAANYASQQQFDQAAKDYDEVLKLDSRNTVAIEGRASIAMKTNDLDKAAALYSEAIKADSKQIRYYQYRAYIYEVKGDLKKSLADNEKVLQMEKDNADALARKTRIETRLAQEQAQQLPPVPPPLSSAPQGKP